jgi:hypothetical protein
MVKKLLITGLLAASSAMFTAQVSAELVTVRSATLVRLLSNSEQFGYCMAFFDSVGVAEMAAATGCNTGAVSFNCQAAPEFGAARAETARNWSSAQLAFVTGNRVNVVIDTMQRYNNQYCVVKRIDNLQ